MINTLFELSIITIIVWIVLIKGYATEELSFSDDESKYATEISPALTEYTVTSNSKEEHRTFVCKGNEPVQWYFKQYDDNVFKKKSLSSKVFSKDRKNFIHFTLLSLSGATYLDTGRYYCAPLVVDPNLIEKFQNSSIYIFVEHETHLIASPDGYNTWFLTEDNNSFIPCRPTSPDINVQIVADETNITNYNYYDRKFGFLFHYSLPTAGIYTCIANKNGFTEERTFNVFTKNLLTIRNEYAEHTIVGQNLTFHCSLNSIIHGSYLLMWNIPEKLINQPGRVQFDQIKLIGYKKSGSIQLNIQNITLEDNGDIICQLFPIDFMIDLYTETYKLQVIPPSKNYLKLKLLNAKNRIIRPAGYHVVKFTIQVSSIPTAILEWIGPDNKAIETISERMRMNTNNESSELVIRNLKVSDSGVYKLIANNTNEKKEINITLLVEDLEILPDLTEHILTINSTKNDCSLTCKGNEPVQWYFEQYDGNLLKKKSSLLKMFSKDQNNYTYLSLLSLSNATYIDTGYYFCTPMSVKSELVKNFKNIYIFVQDETHLFSIPDDFDKVLVTYYLNVILPCRPTSPDINVKLFYDDDEITTMIQYDNKRGYITTAFNLDKKYACVAQRNNISEQRQFIIHSYDTIRINNENSDYVVSGQNLTLNCTSSFPFYNYNLKWIFKLDEMKNQSERIRYDDKKSFYMKPGNIQLNIQNVTTEDNGIYVCEFNYHYNRMNKTYKLQVHAPNETHLSLKVLDNKNTITRPVGYHSVQWKIQVSANPKAILEWRDPEGNKLKTILEKIYIKNDNHSSQLIIKDLELYDSGNYTLIAYNEAGQKEIIVTLFVEEKPKVVLINSLNSEDLYCEMGKMCTFEFRISGYPLPEVMWAFQNCINYTTICEQTYVQKQYMKSEIISSVEEKSLITMNINESTTLIYKASNTFGKSIKHYKVWTSDEFKGFQIKGPSIIVAGDNITIVCGVSRQNYFGDITWIYPNENLNETKINVTENKTEFSHLSYLTVEKITYHFNGNIGCAVNRKTQSVEKLPETETKIFAVKVEEPYEPMLNSSSNKITWKITGEPVEMRCVAFGMPLPSISWFKNNRPLRFDESRLQLKNQNQTLLIKLTKSEDEGTYMCNATNRLGSVTLTYYLSEDTRIGDIVFCCMLTILLVVIVNGGVLWFIKEREMKKKLTVYHKNEFKKGTVKSWNHHLGIEEQAHLLPYDSRWEIARNKIELGEQIGSGAFGIVYKAKATGILDDNTVTTVAVKTVRPSTIDPCQKIALVSELKIMTHLGRHMNVVNLLGACTSFSINKKLMVIVEYCCFGSIDRYMQKHKNKFINQITPDGSIDHNIETVADRNHNYENVPFKINISESRDITSTQITSDGHSVTNKVKPKRHLSHYRDDKNIDSKCLCTNDLLYWSFQISKGMEFLTSRKILHGDLATRNILLSENNIIKICDFGLAKNMYKSEIYKKSKKTLLPVKWLAIESIRDGIFSTASDVWSFGVVLWEIFSLAAVPYPNIQIQDLLDTLVQGYRMGQPKYSNTEIYNIMLDCWKMEPNERPSFTQLFQRLGDLLQESTKSNYIKLNEHYEKMYDKILPSTDVLSLLATPKHSNNPTNAPDCHTESSQQISVCSVSTSEFEMKPIVNNACYSNLI